MTNTPIRQQAVAQAKDLNAEPIACISEALSHQSVAFIEFQLTPFQRVGYATGQLFHYELVGQQTGEQPQTLTLAFPTADIVLTGLRLQGICKLLSEGKLTVVRALPERYQELRASEPFVSKIEVRPVGKA